MTKKMNNARNLTLKKSCIGATNLFSSTFFFGSRINGWLTDSRIRKGICFPSFFECFKPFGNNLALTDQFKLAGDLFSI